MNQKLDLAVSLTEDALQTLRRAQRGTYAPDIFAHYWRADEELSKAKHAMQQAMSVTNVEWEKHLAVVRAHDQQMVDDLRAINIRKAMMAITNEALNAVETQS